MMNKEKPVFGTRSRVEVGAFFAEGDLIFLQLLQKNEMNRIRGRPEWSASYSVEQ